MTQDCGHPPSPHQDFTTGTAHFHHHEICWDCAGELDLFYMGMSDSYFGYLNMKDRTVVNWPGTVLGRVVDLWDRRHNRAGHLTHVVVRDPLGRLWYGDGAGDGMILRLHRSKRRVS